MKYSINTTYREPCTVVIEFDSVEELNAAKTIVTLYNFDALYKVIIGISNENYYKVAYTFVEIKGIERKLILTTYWTDIRLIDELERLGKYLRRSYESV